MSKEKYINIGNIQAFVYNFLHEALYLTHNVTLLHLFHILSHYPVWFGRCNLTKCRMWRVMRETQNHGRRFISKKIMFSPLSPLELFSIIYFKTYKSDYIVVWFFRFINDIKITTLKISHKHILFLNLLVAYCLQKKCTAF